MTGYLLCGLCVGIIGILLSVLKAREDKIKDLEYERDYLFDKLHDK